MFTSSIERRASCRPSIGASATKLLAWSYARQGRDSLAIATEERLVARYGGTARQDIVASAYLDIAHDRFNQKNYRAAAERSGHKVTSGHFAPDLHRHVVSVRGKRLGKSGSGHQSNFVLTGKESQGIGTVDIARCGHFTGIERAVVVGIRENREALPPRFTLIPDTVVVRVSEYGAFDQSVTSNRLNRD